MPSIQITGNQIVYYSKTIELPEDEYAEIMGLYAEYVAGGGLDDVMQWLVDGDSGFTEDDVVEYGDVEDFDLNGNA